MPRVERLDEHSWQELRSIIDEEIGRLPEKYQAPLVLCHLEGKSHDQAAKQLGCRIPRVWEKAEPPKAERKEQNAIAGPAVIAGIKQNSTDLFGDPLPQGALLRLGTVRLRHHEAVWGVAFSPDGTILASIASDGVIRLWDPSTGPVIRDARFAGAAKLECGFFAGRLEAGNGSGGR